jgi:glycosyltransferase involved in cell wall biosynthesis
MRILWLTNVPLPEASLLMGEKPTPFGGWLINASVDLATRDEIELYIAFPKTGIESYEMLKGDKVIYFAFKSVKGNDKELIEENIVLRDIINDVNPDIVHIFGTEAAHTLAMINVCNSYNKRINTVISIQGLVSIYAQHYMANLPFKVQKKFTLRDFIRQDNLIHQQKTFVQQGKLEIESLQKTKHVIGRTTWDKACTALINPFIKYHFCNETLREEFYKHTWNITECEKHSIFVSQGSYPIKGLHLMLEAMPYILKQFPDTKLYIGGNNIIKSDNLKEKLKKTSYSKYLKNMIEEKNLNNQVLFTGILNEKQMCDRYLKSNVFVCPSSIENSPNSLGEAMILGVPCVASDVGGVADMLKHNEEGYVYQADAAYMLAYYVCEIFKNENLALSLSKKAREHALQTHDREVNTNRLIEIYRNISSSGEFN